MFGNAKINELEDKVSKLNYTIKCSEGAAKDYREKIQELKAEIERLNSFNEQKARTTPMQVDFAKMNAFSIERQLVPSGKEPVTVIGYWNLGLPGNNTVGGWLLYCSDETHNRLVEEFNAYMKGSKYHD